jgi:chromosome segregation ATPase
MKSKEMTNAESRPRSSPIEVPSKKAIEAELANASKDISDLEAATSSAPYVNEAGESECPFAESLYAKKEELEEKVSGKVNVLSAYLMGFDAEKMRCQEELDRIQEDYKKLNLQETSDHYAEAVLRLTEKCRSLQESKDAVTAVLVRARAALKRSKGRKFPGRKPQQQFSLPAGPSDPSPSNSPSPNVLSNSGGLGNEVTDLMSLGPLGPTEKNR